MLRLAFLVLFLAQPAVAAQSWSTKDTTLELTFDATLLVDLLQTSAIASYPDRHELNPVLGPRPSHVAINAYFVAGALAHFGIALLLPDSWRTLWQVVWIGMELGWIAWNVQGAKIGLGVPW
jgi:hypothetical protein